ncbi:MAG: diaminopimelate epimerase [Crocinitomicaceae bacterium]|nr:diaminopimelate epimerase [Crocinitomicaceae bacterium]MDG1777595.1 diaminopimelate epimerase [Crocinitomicaceae bacterium]
MKLIFSKYQGTGNDFVMVDNMDGAYNSLSMAQLKFLCDRKLGVGADGLIKLSKKDGFDFEVEYFNADGSQSFCGNGARCSVAFAKAIGLIDHEASFYAIDGAHKAFVDDTNVRLEMLPVAGVEQINEDFLVDTGSPHYIHLVASLKSENIIDYGRLIRYSDRFSEEGVNVNTMARVSDSEISVATYERGVEDETLSCGTGVTACALVFMFVNNQACSELIINTKGGVLKVEAKRNKKEFTDIWLTGPATFVFDGSIEV